jgi:hypothetical protein
LWFLAGPVAFGLLSFFQVRDARERPRGIYGLAQPQSSGAKVAFWVCAAVVSVALLATSLQVGFYFGGWPHHGGWWP